MLDSDTQKALHNNVQQALAEDIGSGDITAQLIPSEAQASGRIIAREAAVLCGIPWANAVFQQINSNIKLAWCLDEGTQCQADQTVCEFSGPAAALLTAERSALNFLQTLSGTATVSAFYAEKVKHTQVRLLDTRKTLPGLRMAQKYAVRMGGCSNHRIGLYDAFLIKENHISACGSINAAVSQAKKVAPGKQIEVEVESLDELQLALDAGADIVMLDNFSIDAIKQGVKLTAKRCLLEASGGITDASLVPIAETGVDFISIGALTKDCKAIDLSMRLDTFGQ